MTSAKNRQQTTAWFDAVRAGHLGAVNEALEAGVSVTLSRQGLYGHENALFVMGNHTDTKVLDRLVHAGIDTNVRNARGMSALHVLAGMGNDVMVTGLLRHGVAADVFETNGGTPLMWAAHNGHVTVVDLLLAHGANPTTIDSKGLNSLDWARKGNDHATIARLEQWVLRHDAAASAVEHQANHAAEFVRRRL